MMPAGRPTSLTPEVQAAIVESIKKGNYRATAAAAAGVHRNRLAEWEGRGEKGEEPYAEFACALQTAEAEAESTMLEKVRTAQPGVPGVQGADLWTATAWIMERRWPKRWAQKVRQAVTEEIDAFTDRLQRRLDDATYRKVLDASREDASSEGAPRH